MVAYEDLKQREKTVGNSQKWSRSLTGEVAYESFSLQSSLSDKSNGISQCCSKLELVAYESGRKESFDFMSFNIYGHLRRKN